MAFLTQISVQLIVKCAMRGANLGSGQKKTQTEWRQVV